MGPPSPLHARLRFEKAHRGGKAVTIMKVSPLHPEGKTALLRFLQKRLGTGGALKAGLLELQGDQRERLVALLTPLGYRVSRGN